MTSLSAARSRQATAVRNLCLAFRPLSAMSMASGAPAGEAMSLASNALHKLILSFVCFLHSSNKCSASSATPLTATRKSPCCNFSSGCCSFQTWMRPSRISSTTRKRLSTPQPRPSLASDASNSTSHCTPRARIACSSSKIIASVASCSFEMSFIRPVIMDTSACAPASRTRSAWRSSPSKRRPSQSRLLPEPRALSTTFSKSLSRFTLLKSRLEFGPCNFN
mmetsp:Transcript_31626/g.79574  ORF Transcript_31626/g.79574 Transcript_31626/m.79574 type:complete len:222 (-) Transcript_31626:607-1272(-)